MTDNSTAHNSPLLRQCQAGDIVFCMRYEGTVIRPPSEANSYLLQVTYGCTHNRCAFCGTYPDKPFSIRPVDEVWEDIDLASRMFPDTRRVFLCDGNPMVLSTKRLVEILDRLASAFPRLQRVRTYANAKDLLRKSVNDLKLLREKRLQMVYLGLESGSDEVLRRVNKGITAQEMVTGVKKARSAGIRVSVIGLLGLGGVECSSEHARETGRVIGEMAPEYFSLLTLMLIPETPLFKTCKNGLFQELDPEALLVEMRQVIQHVQGIDRCIFRTNHASNYLPLAGTLTRDSERLLATIDQALAQGRSALRPEGWRAL